MNNIDNLSYKFNFSNLPTLVNKEIENYLLSKTEKCLFELVEENKKDITKITERLLKGEMNRIISKMNEDANVRFDIILYQIIMPYDKFKIEYEDLRTNKSYTEVFDNNYLTSNFCIEYLINSELEQYDNSNSIKSKIIFYRNSFSSLHLNQMIKKEKEKWEEFNGRR